MPIDHAEALQRGREYWIRNGQMYRTGKGAKLIAAEIERAVRDTALGCQCAFQARQREILREMPIRSRKATA